MEYRAMELADQGMLEADLLGAEVYIRRQ